MSYPETTRACEPLRGDRKDLSTGLAVLKNPEKGLHGYVVFVSHDPSGKAPGVHVCTQIIHHSSTFTGPKGFHLHKYGDLSQGCQSAGPHYNPTNQTHGGLGTPVRHAGDFGNLTFSRRPGNLGGSQAFASFYVPDLSLNEVTGRAIVLHAKEDDLGQGGNPESLETGNSGARVACGVVVAVDPERFPQLP